MPPNLFAFATSELSQDAALAYLLSWADPSHAATHPVLHSAGRDLLARLFAKHDHPTPDPALSVTAQRQVHYIDVLVTVGDVAVVAIEDKTNTGHHSDQLARYLEVLRAHFPGRTHVPIFLKTGEQCDYADVHAKGWRVIERRDLLACLRPHADKTDHAILVDFVEHLEQIDRHVHAWTTAPLDQWTPRAWQGFFGALTNHVEGGWDYVPNQTGGFMGFWWGWRPVEGGQLYPQLEDGRLVIKLSVEEGHDRATLRDHWLPYILGDLAPLGFVRPARLGHGKTMTLAVVDEYRRTTDGRLDLPATVAVLREAAARLHDCVARHHTPGGT